MCCKPLDQSTFLVTIGYNENIRISTSTFESLGVCTAKLCVSVDTRDEICWV